MNKKALSLAITIAMALPTTVSTALSLGDIESNSSLNQPFRGKINLLSTSAAEANNLRIRVASPEVFNRVGIDRPAFLNGIRFKTTIQNGRPVILVSSDQPINEPFLNFLLEVSWANGQLLKEYTVLLDPPVLLQADTAIASNGAGVRAEPKAQGRITRPIARQQNQQQIAQQRRQVQQRALQATRAPQTAQEKFAADARRVLAQQTPQRARATTGANNSYRVRRGDTLSKVAKRLAYRGVRSEQMMIALFEKNRSAFINNNINNLKSGVLLKRPSIQETRAINSRVAKEKMVAQSREWKKTHGTAVATETNNPKSTVPANTASQQAHMTVAGTNKATSGLDASGKAELASLRQKLMLTNESLTTKKKENQELKSRVTELESLLRKKNRLITLKSEQLAKLQEAASGGAKQQSAPAANTNVDPVVPVSQDTVDGSDLQAQITNELAQENGMILRPEGQAPVVEDTAPPVDTTPAQDSTVSAFADEAVEPESDILSMLQSPLVLGSGALLGLLGLGGMWYMRRRNNNGDYEEFDAIEIDNQMGDFEDSDYDTSMIDESEFVSHDNIAESASVAPKDDVTADNGEEDILQEADVYIVYGLHDQAESELKQAIASQPDNMAYRAKLLENYKAAGNAEAFEEEAKVFINHESPDKEKFMDDITEWGKLLNPGSNLFNGLAAGAAAATGVEMVAGTAVADDTNTSQDLVDISSDKTDMEMDSVELDDDLEDFNLDDLLSDEDDVEEVVSGEIDTDFDDDMTSMLDLDDASSVQFEETGTTSLAEEVDTMDDLLEVGDSSETPEIDNKLSIDIDEEAEKTDLDKDVTSLSLDIGSDDFNKLMPEDTAYKGTIDSVDNSFEENQLTDSEDNLLTDFDDNLSFLELDNEEGVIEEAQLDTKLDLAKAYIDMGDIEGARSTLEEVILDGSDDQKREAEKLLHSTG